LLNVDDDYTLRDRFSYIDAFLKVQDQIGAELDKSSPDFKAINKAIDAALDDIVPIQANTDGTVVTATNTVRPTMVVAPPPPAIQMESEGDPNVMPPPPPPRAESEKVVVPSRLVEELRKTLNQSSGQA